MFYPLIRPALFRLQPETAHHLTLAGLQALTRLGRFNPLAHSPASKPRSVMGLEFPNPVGLAAGLDKNGDCLEGLGALGFGFLEIGTVTPRPQPGNLPPRLFRLPEAEALINRMGFNNKGVDYLVERVKQTRYSGIVGINIGKNRDTAVENALEDYLACLRKVYSVAAYVTVNISSPNTPGLRSLQTGENLDHLLAGLAAEREVLAQQHQKRVPLAVKIAPDLEPADIEAIAAALLHHGIDAVIATNTTASRAGVEGLPHAAETGGLSGKPVFERSTAVVRQLAAVLDGKLPIIACGGIASADDARQKLDAGASLVQIYTGLIYRGPGLVSAIVRGL
ncbi:quinone-dependent dihydroorotate dehydrogenase [Methylomagnum ishizawai]|uniref:quinone-dependent dihydroorotate dehydrogenase n=1 Tax=Methylomagnum ishizawai TaxID=1760988 RepID=UPI001C32A8A5|nr:quinone-dependent dihydroorotate dehydrogenase [Methylomagnum ishizawai]BBL73571.1 dihydroorotate dehydrogenase (quinone) [Methylomagnum ishizawai]